MVHKKEEGTYYRIEKLTKEMHGFLSPRRGLPLLLIPEYSGINKEQRIHDRSKTAHMKPPFKCFLTLLISEKCSVSFYWRNWRGCMHNTVFKIPSLHNYERREWEVITIRTGWKAFLSDIKLCQWFWIHFFSL